MPSARREQLLRMSGKRIEALLRKVSKADPGAELNVTMYWPPEEGRVSFLVGTGDDKRDWDFEIPARHWRLPDDRRDKPAAVLSSDIDFVFRSVWKDLSPRLPGIEAYFRLHDDIEAIDLRSGRRIRDTERSTYREPARLPFRKPRSLRTCRAADGELIGRGDSIAKIKRALGVTEEPESTVNIHTDQTYWLPKRGIRIWLSKGKIASIFYSRPFAQKICGVWIGMHAWQVDALLGRANKETCHYNYSGYEMGGGKKSGFPPPLRNWEYERSGPLCLEFDAKDRVRWIGR
jgi:hypothetical protein